MPRGAWLPLRGVCAALPFGRQLAYTGGGPHENAVREKPTFFGLLGQATGEAAGHAVCLARPPEARGQTCGSRGNGGRPQVFPKLFEGDSA